MMTGVKKNSIEEIRKIFSEYKDKRSKTKDWVVINEIDDEIINLLKNNNLIRIYDAEYNILEIGYKGLKIGDKLKSLRGTTTMDDIGMSGLTFETTGIVKDKIYEVVSLTDVRFRTVPYIIDETGCHTIAYATYFDKV